MFVFPAVEYFQFGGIFNKCLIIKIIKLSLYLTAILQNNILHKKCTQNPPNDRVVKLFMYFYFKCNTMQSFRQPVDLQTLPLPCKLPLEPQKASPLNTNGVDPLTDKQSTNWWYWVIRTTHTSTEWVLNLKRPQHPSLLFSALYILPWNHTTVHKAAQVCRRQRRWRLKKRERKSAWRRRTTDGAKKWWERREGAQTETRLGN